MNSSRTSTEARIKRTVIITFKIEIIVDTRSLVDIMRFLPCTRVVWKVRGIRLRWKMNSGAPLVQISLSAEVV